MKVALVHDWLTGMRGGERVLERIAAMYPGAPIHTLVWKRGSVSPALESHPIVTSFLQRLPGAEQCYRWFLPLFPRAIESFDLSGFDLVISTSHAVAKGAVTPPGAFHLSYIHTPMRYVWDLERDYFPPGRFPWPLSWYVRRTCARLRAWDRATSGRPDALLANSRHVAARIRTHWGREAEVVHPPVDVDRFHLTEGARDHYLLAGAFAPYKRSDLALEACTRLGRRVLVAGSGPEEARLRRLAPPGTEFRGWVGDEQIGAVYAGAKALLFPGEEDFGIMPVEALASGTPVIAFGRGGALETVGRGASPEALAGVAAGGVARVPGGVLFGTQTVAGLTEAIERFEGERFDPAELRALSLPFAAEGFDRNFREAFERAHAAWRRGGAASAGPLHVVLFSPIAFDDLHQRPQKLAESFRERGANVLFVEPAGGRAALGRGVAALLRSVLAALALHLGALPEVLTGRRISARPRVRTANGSAPGLEIIRGPLAVPVHKSASPLLHAFTVAAHRRFLRRSILGRFPADAPVAALVEHPFWGAVLEPGDFPAVFYDCLDDAASFAGRCPAARFHAWEERLLGFCAGAFATARVLEERIRALHPALAVVRAPNGVDVDWFQSRAEHACAALPASTPGRPVAGYVGVIGRWLDYDLLDDAIGACPELDFVFVGPAGEPAALERLRRHPNFRWIPRRPYEEIPGLVRRLDVCLIPFAPGAIARTTNPVKLFEYFALGKPVVATPLVELEEYRAERLVYWAPTAEAFVAALRAAAAESDEALRAKRVQVARENSWRARAAGMLSTMEAAARAACGTHVAV